MDWDRYKAVSMARFPSLYVDEADLLNQTFFVIGNGLEWKNGQLTDGCDVYYTSKTIKQLAEDSYVEHCNFLRSIKAPRSIYPSRDPEVTRARELQKRKMYVVEGFADDCYQLNAEGELIRHIYPMHHEYSRIMRIPDDVQTDWLLAAEQAIYLDPAYWTRTVKDSVLLMVAKIRIDELLSHR